MPNDALAYVLKNSSWFEPSMRRLYGEDFDIGAYIDQFIGSRGSSDRTPSPDAANVSAFGTNAPEAPSFDNLSTATAGYFSNPANLGSFALGAIPGVPFGAGPAVGAPLGAFAGQQFGEPSMVGISDIDPETGVPMGRPPAVDPRTIGMLAMLGAPIFGTIMDQIPADLFSPAELQTPHPDISAQPGQGYAGPSTPGIPSGVQPSLNAVGELSIGEHPDPSTVGTSTSNEGTSNQGVGVSSDTSFGMDNPGNASSGSTESGGMSHDTMARGGLVRRRNLFGPNPPGPDEGAAYLQPGEMVMPKVAVEHFGKKRFFNMIREAHEARGEHSRMMKDVTPSRGASMRGRRMFG